MFYERPFRVPMSLDPHVGIKDRRLVFLVPLAMIHFERVFEVFPFWQMQSVGLGACEIPRISWRAPRFFSTFAVSHIFTHAWKEISVEIEARSTSVSPHFFLATISFPTVWFRVKKPSQPSACRCRIQTEASLPIALLLCFLSCLRGKRSFIVLSLSLFLRLPFTEDQWPSSSPTTVSKKTRKKSLNDSFFRLCVPVEKENPFSSGGPRFRISLHSLFLPYTKNYYVSVSERRSCLTSAFLKLSQERMKRNTRVLGVSLLTRIFKNANLLPHSSWLILNFIINRIYDRIFFY